MAQIIQTIFAISYRFFIIKISFIIIIEFISIKTRKLSIICIYQQIRGC